MGLYKLCTHKGRERDRCEHAWWASYRGIRVSLPKWANGDIDSKLEAAALLDEFRTAVRAGTFDTRGKNPPKLTEPTSALTFREFAEIYRERHVEAKGLALASQVRWKLKPLIERFGDRILTQIKTADIEDYIADLRKPRIVGKRPEPRTLAASSINRQIELLRHMMNWALEREYIERTPFKRGAVIVIKKLKEDNQRRRRISAQEEAGLLAASPPHLRAMITAAFDTGMRRGEMLALRFADVDFKRGMIILRGETTKSRRTRIVPFSTTRLRKVLEWLRLDADGDLKPDDTLVFSDEIGRPLPLFHHFWMVAVLKANGIKPSWSAALKYKGLSRESKEAFRKINLHWHDLRHEYASRLVERGVPLAQVRDLLGHSSITTTERYDNQKLENLVTAAARLETGAVFDGSFSPTDHHH